MEDQVPKAVIRFKQGVGRLIRSHDDRGEVLVLDPRIVTKHYGRLFRAALPEGVELRPLDEEDHPGPPPVPDDGWMDA